VSRGLRTEELAECPLYRFGKIKIYVVAEFWERIGVPVVGI
jgi:hypothetical protein